jgi:hypothetical protein
MASDSFGTKKRPVGRAFREDLLGEALSDLYKDVDDAFETHEARTTALEAASVNPVVIRYDHADLDGGDTISIEAEFDLTVVDFYVVKTSAGANNAGANTVTVANEAGTAISPAISIRNCDDKALFRMTTSWDDAAANVDEGDNIKLVFAKADNGDNNACSVFITVMRR